MGLALEARQFLRSTHHGLLSTFSAKFTGFPYGSVTPFVLDHDGQPVILISTLAEHTKNIIANPKVSLLVFTAGDDLVANARLTLIGEAQLIEKNDMDLRARYLRYLPQAASYFDMHDFNFTASTSRRHAISRVSARWAGWKASISPTPPPQSWLRRKQVLSST